MNHLVRLVLTVYILAFTSFSLAADVAPNTVELFVTHDQLDSALDVKKSAKGLSIYVIDEAKRLEMVASESIPKPTKQERASQAGLDEYKKRVTPYIVEQAKKQKNDLINAWQGIEKAMRYQIQKTPAVVINGNYVVYGSPVSLSVYRWKELTKRGAIE
ncbi:DUF1525 domain-containing protein [Vibrio gangliei]|uniref:DUF1525 domain-containing protein n=1 Tax=Vibrio gangliei TaxID=2077090 RepID=UPI000D01B4DC|nr:DUF1525 domain-containing protein [Vibrio gangliei]